MSAAPVIALTAAHKTYRTGDIEVAALRGIDLEVEAGEYLAIMGPSGSGKSSLMNILGCLDVLTGGAYRLAGEDVEHLGEPALARVRNRQIGFVFQQFHLLPSLSALRNVELPMLYGRIERAERRERATAALRSVGLGDRLNHRPGELSGGQQQRAAVARALAADPTIILADEPTGNLDSVSTDEVLELFDRLHADGRTIVLITHERDVAARASRIVTMRDGQVVSDSRGEDAAG
ncbi:ABC transporter ATP-binding protein [Microbacterium sp. SYP-A9085]|uniref:ABC transporter ATP-binding protein n=1 Tax=Microbacterium sp. SYP-A9085 TaxID=2664454 RepID=UPI0034647409